MQRSEKLLSDGVLTGVQFHAIATATLADAIQPYQGQCISN